MCLSRAVTACVVMAAAGALATPAAAQDGYPARPVTMIVPFAAGGASDVIARLIA
ncbi:MAG: tripartite tricarboxylate transporter substrate binding protein BugD, partial [Xanthobacteraceae bacterium]|nr:tripartite tricarboxylate transporter substrate binding protein BugD [Xanthobacteraceae bacterium]